MAVSNLQVAATRLEPEIVKKLDEVAKAKGISRSDLLRLWVKEGLARLSLLSDDEKKMLGVLSLENSSPNKNAKEV